MPLGVSFLHEGGIALQNVRPDPDWAPSAWKPSRGFSRDHGLAPAAMKPPGMPWTSSVGRAQVRLQNRVSRLACQHFRADFSLAVVLLIEGQPLPGFEFVFAGAFTPL